jgi:pilus assembly protein CpaB
MRRSLISLLWGLVLAALAMFLIYYYKGAEPSATIQTAKVVVAARDIPADSIVRRDYIQYSEWPAQSVPVGAFRDIETLVSDKEGGGNRIVLRTIRKGEPLLQQQISGFGGKATLSRKIGKDKRAFSVRVNDASGVAGFILPGDHVDIILTQGSAGNEGTLTSDVILQNIMILGVDQLTDEGSEKPTLARTVTLEVTAEQAQKLALAQQSGTLSMTLRGYTDNAGIITERVSINDLTGKGGVVPVIELEPVSTVSDSSAAGFGDTGHDVGRSDPLVIGIRRGMNFDTVAIPQK